MKLLVVVLPSAPGKPRTGNCLLYSEECARAVVVYLPGATGLIRKPAHLGGPYNRGGISGVVRFQAVHERNLNFRLSMTIKERSPGESAASESISFTAAVV